MISVQPGTPGPNCVEMEFELITSELYSKLGPRYLPLEARIVCGTIYTVLLISGVLGNLSTCVVIGRNRYMHTATNLYLLNLAVGDLMTLLCGLPLELSNILLEQYPFKLGTFFCSLRNVVSELSAYVSVLTISAFTVERYIAICHPLRAQSFSGFRRSIITILVVWVAAVTFALPQGMTTEVRRFVPYPNASQSNFSAVGCPQPVWNDSLIPDSLVCGPIAGNLPSFFINLSAFLFFLFPMVFISTLYILIGRQLCRSGVTRHVGGHEEKNKSRKMLIRMLVAVVSAFFVCMAPFHFQRLITIYSETTSPALMLILFYLSGSCFYVSCTLNPLLYNLMSVKFRHAFMQTLHCCLPPNMRRQNRFLGQRSRTMQSTVMNSMISSRCHGTSSGVCRLSRPLLNGSPPSCAGNAGEEKEERVPEIELQEVRPSET